MGDVQVADFNGDRRLDLVVAAFGWRDTGEILTLENQTKDWSNPVLVARVVDSRHGAISVPVADLNGDHRPDFMALVGQEHETVVAYLNQGDGLVPVSGTVTLDGKPLADAAVGFFADVGGTPAVGTTDAQGKFTLSTHKPGDGATQGQNVVTVSKQSNLDAGKEVEESEIVRMKNESPVKYFSPKTSDIKVEVKYGMEPVTIDLKSGR